MYSDVWAAIPVSVMQCQLEYAFFFEKRPTLERDTGHSQTEEVS